MKSCLVGPAVIAAAFVLTCPARAETQIPSILQCSALSTNPQKRKSFETEVSFALLNSQVRGERSTGNGRGKEVYSGTIGANQVIKITGRGANYNSNLAWRSDLSGSIKDGDTTVLKGSIDTNKGGHRDCTLTLLLESGKLLALLPSEGVSDRTTAKPPVSTSANNDERALLAQEEQTKKQLADMAKDLAEKQKSLQASQDELKRQQAQAERDIAEEQKALQARQAAVAKDLDDKQKALQADRDKLSLATKQLAARQNTLEADHDVLKQQQAKTSENVNLVQKLLDGIILPTTEDPNSWMVRVAAVPVQQQQFCRVVDKFYDDIGKVYQTRNEIKENSLLRDRQLDMAALLPHGEFSNWVVRVKEVTQTSDGGAAVMLQPPCRAMLGSNTCQKDGSKIQATIPSDSPIFRELGKVSAGDFVVVSGTVLYAEPSEGKPAAAHAVYQAGSYCSNVDGSKQEDVFVTQISYLVQLH